MNVAQDLVAGRYRLQRIIGSGGMGRVWLADDELLRRRVAVKEISMPAGAGPDPVLDARLTTVREARAAARLDHPGVVGIYDVVWCADRPWIVMEYVESRSLDAVLRESGPLSHAEAARIGLGVLSALRAAHAAGVLHRDVKPHNVLLATDGRVVLTDFGVAKIKDAEPGTGPLLASPYFVAPERLRAEGGEAGEAADLWSLGATLYAAVEGRAPFQRPSTIASLTAVLTEPPDPARFPGPLTPIINRLLTRDPARRLTAEEAQAELGQAADRAVGVVPMLAKRRIPRPTGAPTPNPSTPSIPAPAPTRGIPALTTPALTRGIPALTAPAPTAPAPTTPALTTPAPSLPVPGLASGVPGPGPSALGMSMILGRVGGAGPARPGLARGARIALAAAAVLLAGAGTAVALGHRPATPADRPAAASTGPVARCAAGGQAVTGQAESRGYAVPAGWLWHSDPAGFDLAVPRDWARSPDGTAACFRDPGGTRSFRVDASARLAGPTLAYWREREENALAAGSLPGYRRVTLDSLPAEQGGAAWEFTWQPDGEPAPRHERRLLLPVGDRRAYLVEWTTPEQDWNGTEPYLRLVLASLARTRST